MEQELIEKLYCPARRIDDNFCLAIEDTCDDGIGGNCVDRMMGIKLESRENKFDYWASHRRGDLRWENKEDRE